jgi:molybdate transport system ATP-binding protein
VTVRVRVRHQLERIELDVDLELHGGLTAFYGPSGAGKTSTLNVIAGLLHPSTGLVTIDDAVLVDTVRGIWTRPHERRIGYVFQDARLFPHLRVRQNLSFGRWFQDTSSRQRIALDEIVTLLDLAPLLARYPARLSGGERRRVALGRALLSSPRLLLLDEPLGSLDMARRQEILPYLDRLIAERRLPMIYVTHDLREMEGRTAQVVTMAEGRARVTPHT